LQIPVVLPSEIALSTSRSKFEPVGRRWRPILSLVNELSHSRRQPTSQDRFAITKKVFLTGVIQGLRGEVMESEAAIFRAGDMQMVGAFVEGEAMGLAISDRLMWWRASKWTKLHDASSTVHPYEIHTGLGMGFGILGVAPRAVADDSTASVWQWFALDGFGFQQSLCNPRRYIAQRQRPKLPKLPEYAYKVFDQGLGRSLWFIFGGDAAKIAEAIANFDACRRSDIWLGTGVAAAHTEGTSGENLAELVSLAGCYRQYLAVGAAVAAHVKSCAGTKSRVPDDVCYALAAVSSEAAAAIVETAHQSMDDHSSNKHQQWQQHILKALNR